MQSDIKCYAVCVFTHVAIQAGFSRSEDASDSHSPVTQHTLSIKSLGQLWKQHRENSGPHVLFLRSLLSLEHPGSSLKVELGLELKEAVTGQWRHTGYRVKLPSLPIPLLCCVAWCCGANFPLSQFGNGDHRVSQTLSQTLRGLSQRFNDIMYLAGYGGCLSEYSLKKPSENRMNEIMYLNSSGTVLSKQEVPSKK